MKEYGFTACERGVVDACESGATSNIVLIVIVILAVIVAAYYLWPKASVKKKSVHYVVLTRKVLNYYGLAGFYWEEKEVLADDYYDFFDTSIDEGWVECDYRYKDE